MDPKTRAYIKALRKPDKLASCLLDMTRLPSNKNVVKHIKQQHRQAKRTMVTDMKFSTEITYV